MKKYGMLLVALVAVSQLAAAQVNENQSGDVKYFSDITSIQTANLAAAEKGYCACLKSENEGVIESGLAHVAMLKLVFPSNEFKGLCRQVEKVAMNSRSLEMRYKAYLVSTLLQNPGLFTNEANNHFESPDELFGALASRMQQIVASNSR